MTEETTIPTWGYSKDGAKLFEIKAGGKLPSGYVDSPAKVSVATKKAPKKPTKKKAS